MEVISGMNDKIKKEIMVEHILESEQEVKALKKRVQEAEGELSIVKGIGNNSPEIKSLKSEVAALKQQLHTERESLKKEADELMMKKIEHYEKEIALVREDAQIEILNQTKKYADNIFERDSRIKELGIINKDHQKLNSELVKEKDVELTYSVKRINELLKISEDHQKLNGELREDNKAFEISNKAYGKLLKDASDKNIRLAKQINEALEKLSKYEDKAAHYRRKAVL
jgi:capsule polysaccharide export protein KpsE/RkpR